MEVPETVLLELQSSAYRLKKNLEDKRIIEKQQETALERARIEVRGAENELYEVAQFLQEHNPGACKSDETWYDKLGIPNPEGVKNG